MITNEDDCRTGLTSFLEDNNSSSSSSSSNTSSPNNTPSNTPRRGPAIAKKGGFEPKYKLISEGDVLVYRLNHTRTIISKLTNSKYLRRWEQHHLILTDTDIVATKLVGFMEEKISYSMIEDVNIVSRWDAGQRFCLRVTIPDGSLLIQAPNIYIRDQWMYSIQWKRNSMKYLKLLMNSQRPEVLIKEIKNMVEMTIACVIQDDCVRQFPLEVISNVLMKKMDLIGESEHEQIIVCMTPLLENTHPSQEICDFFSKHCKNSPRSHLVIDLFTPVVIRILKHNMDFGKYPRSRTFIQDYLQSLSSLNDNKKAIRELVRRIHGLRSNCPHPRVLPNIIAVCLAALYDCYENKKLLYEKNLKNHFLLDLNKKICWFTSVFENAVEYDDWRPTLGNLLQPIPFPESALGDEFFSKQIIPTIRAISADNRCLVHSCILGIREGKEGWWNLFCPGGLCCVDDGELFGLMLKTLMNCCIRRKRFLESMSKMIGPCMLLALRDNEPAMDVLCAMLEYETISSADLKMQMITTLQSTDSGKKMYTSLCERQIALRELQQRGGPRKLTLPSKSTDIDLSKMLSSGSFGNLECLSLAFTQVTSACAKDLVKLINLRYLNLWSTQFGDGGLQLLSEHLHKLQVLNLCETPVTDKGLSCLVCMKNLRKLNLNSTSLSALTFESLKEKLPALQEFDVRYTDAW